MKLVFFDLLNSYSRGTHSTGISHLPSGCQEEKDEHEKVPSWSLYSKEISSNKAIAKEEIKQVLLATWCSEQGQEIIVTIQSAATDRVPVSCYWKSQKLVTPLLILTLIFTCSIHISC